MYKTTDFGSGREITDEVRAEEVHDILCSYIAKTVLLRGEPITDGYVEELQKRGFFSEDSREFLMTPERLYSEVVSLTDCMEFPCFDVITKRKFNYQGPCGKHINGDIDVYAEDSAGINHVIEVKKNGKTNRGRPGLGYLRQVAKEIMSIKPDESQRPVMAHIFMGYRGHVPVLTEHFVEVIGNKDLKDYEKRLMETILESGCLVEP